MRRRHALPLAHAQALGGEHQGDSEKTIAATPAAHGQGFRTKRPALSLVAFLLVLANMILVLPLVPPGPGRAPPGHYQGVNERRHPLHCTANMPLDIVQQGFHTHTNNHGIKKVRD